MIVTGVSHRYTHKLLIVVYRLDDSGEEKEEFCVFGGSLTCIKKILSAICGYRPVVVLTRAVNTRVGLLVKQTYKTVLFSDLLHIFHYEKILVDSHIGGGVYGSQLVLCGSCLVVLGLGVDTESPERLVEIGHIGADTGLERSEIVVLKLLSLGRGSAKESSARKLQILAQVIHFLVNYKIFLLRANGSGKALGLGITEKAEKTNALCADSVHRTQQGSLCIKRVARVGAERCGNVKRAVLNKGVGGGIPCGVASCLKGSAKTA